MFVQVRDIEHRMTPSDSGSGKQFGESAVFLQIASILATFNISKALDAHGTEITPEIDYKGGIVTQPEEFVCKIVPRSDAAIDLIMWSH